MTSRFILFVAGFCALAPAAFGQQAVSYPVQVDEIDSISLDADGWLVGKGKGNNELGKASVKVTYPIKFQVEEQMGHAYFWKVGALGFVFLPRVINLMPDSNLDYHLITVPLTIPKVDPHWTDADFPATDPQKPDRDLDWFIERVIGRFSGERRDAFHGPNGIITALKNNRADVNSFSRDTEDTLLKKLRKEQLSFFNDTLDNINSSLYGTLGYSHIKLPAQVVALTKKFPENKVIPKGPQRTELMLLNRCLIDGVGMQGLFPGEPKEIFRMESSYNLEASIKLLPVNEFPFHPILSVRMIGSGAWDQYRVRMLAPDEILALKPFDPRSFNDGLTASFPKDATDEDIKPYVVFEGLGKHYVLSKRGFLVGDGSGVLKDQK